ncbi:multicopper oxidase family protein [Gynuella sunshinyii]|uniref:Putative multicopper oxidase n=1 Tax=Gynuella sunshinyii YC6258 TaxID=1445510 RepID=A0A0C5VTE6_9GAMM|nr:multicopper oxidase family protein [Gynuella sunshinyii]AJQ97461.1 putative multicopper oxidase [Gynuella sunshinyii YC6258]
MMKITRRQWLAGGSKLMLASMLPRPLWAAQTADSTLHLQAQESTVNWLQKPTTLWSYNQTTLHLKQGVPQKIRVTNNLPQATTVHWHGVRVANAMDGVSGLTQSPIQPGEYFEYEVMSPDAGTFWFHSHHNTVEQLARGLYGALIVSGEKEPVFEQDWLLLMDDWLLNEDGQIDTTFNNLHTQAHAGRMGNILSVNAQLGAWKQQTQPGDRVRLRLVNTATNRILQLRPEFPGALLLAKDGQPLMTPEPVGDLIVMGPGERWDLGWLANQTGQLLEVSGQTPLLVAEVNVSSNAAMALPLYPGTMALPANPMPLPSSEIDQKIDLILEGGAMGRLQTAHYQGKTLSFRELVNHGQVWTIAGQAGMSTEPLFRTRPGQTIELQLDNRTAFAHTIHWHGHHAWADNRWQDSLTLTRGQRKTVRLLTGNTGKWLIHCHMIDHQATGMVTWFEVV